MRDGFLDWLAPWASYRTEIERLIDLGERVVLLFHTPYVFRGGSIIVPIMANKMLTHEQLKYRQQRDKSGGKPYEKQMPANFVGEVPDPLEGSDPTFAVGGSKVFEIMGWS